MEFFTLNDGNVIPAVGYGVAFIGSNGETYAAVRSAIEAGYRHIDTAMVYENEAEVGQAVRESGVAREEIFVTSKLAGTFNSYEGAREGLGKSLSVMGLDYIDLYLLHQPKGDVEGAWKALSECRSEGLVRSIGVSNMNAETWNRYVPGFEVKPAVDQIECNPFYQRRNVRELLKNDDVLLECWYPLGHGDRAMLENAHILSMAEKYGKNAGQVILRFEFQEGFVTMPKSTDPQRMKGNIDIFDFSLTEDEMNTIRAMDTGLSTRERNAK